MSEYARVAIFEVDDAALDAIITQIKASKIPAVFLENISDPRLMRRMSTETGSVPPVIDAGDVLRDPRRILQLLCDAIGVEFSNAMLSWAPGPRQTDGVWAKYWYAEVERSTAFAPYRERKIELPKGLHETHRRCREIYDQLYPHRLH
jgi:hypothetical protein